MKIGGLSSKVQTEYGEGFKFIINEGTIGNAKVEVITTYGEPDEEDVWLDVYYIGMFISYDDMD